MAEQSELNAVSDYEQSLGLGAPFFRMLCFDYVPDPQLLAFALSKALQRHPRFGTRLVHTPGGGSRLVPREQPLRLAVRPTLDWTPRAFSVADIPKFVGDIEGSSAADLVTATFTPVSRGSVLSFRQSHTIGDFYSLYLFLAAWAEEFRAAAQIEDLSRYDYPRPCAAPHATTVSGAVKPRKLRKAALADHHLTVINFDKEALTSLRSELATGEFTPSLNDALTAFVVHRYGRKLMGHASGLRLRVPVNVRGVHPMISPLFIGNAIAEAVVPLDDLVDSPAAAARTARSIHDTVRAVRTPEYVASILEVRNGAVTLQDKSMPVYSRHTDILSTNLSKMPFHTLDFGGGPPTQFFGTHTGQRGMSICTAANGLDVRLFTDQPGLTTR